LVPVAGELVAAPAAVIAVILGMVGLRRYETGRAVHVVRAIAGAVLGALAVMVTVVVLIATHVSP
jgi:hypothetical protein